MRPLSMPLPLRTTVAWGRFLNAQPIPWAYGRCSVIPVQYDETRRLYCLADHRIGGVDRVTVAGTETAFIWRPDRDVTDHPVSLLEIALPPPEGAAIVAEVRGALHPQTGALLENPADIAWDILIRCGMPVAASEWGEFRRQCQAAGIVCGGVIDEIKTVRAALSDLLETIGAVWSGGARGWARLWPSN